MDSAQDVAALVGPGGFASLLGREVAAGRVTGVEAGDVSVTRLGAGESFTAWLVRARDARSVGGAQAAGGEAESAGRAAEPAGDRSCDCGGEAGAEVLRPPRVVRVARRPLDELPRSLKGQYEALLRVPEGLGSRGEALEEGSDNVLGAPYVVTTYVPGRVVPAQEWTPRLACALASQVARLHHLLGAPQAVGGGVDGPGPRGGQAGPSDQGVPGDQGACPGSLREAADVLGWWRAHHPRTLEDPRVVPLLAPWWQALAALDPATAGVPRHPLVHGDVVVTNVVVCPHRVPRLIDWEWAGPGDPAKDLALVGGEVTGGPWYARLSRQAVTDMVSRYVAVRRWLAGSAASGDGGQGEEPGEARGGGEDEAEEHDEQVRCLLVRRDAWELLDRMPNLLYCLSRGGQGDYDRWAEELARSLATRLTAVLGPQPG